MLFFIVIMTLTGLFLPAMLNNRLEKLIRMAEHPARSEHPLVKTMVQKFTACYKVKIGVNNVDSFVDKYVYTYKIGGLYLSTWDRLCGQPAIILLLVCSISLIAGYQRTGGQVTNLSTAGMGIIAGILLIVYNAFFERRGKLQALSYEMKDYLENSLRTKLEQEYIYPELLREQRKERMRQEEAEEEAKAEAEAEAQAEFAVAGNVPTVVSQPVLCREQEIIEEILREYLS